MQRKERRSPPPYPIFDVMMRHPPGSYPKMRGMNGDAINSEADFQAYALKYHAYIESQKQQQAAQQAAAAAAQQQQQQQKP